MVLGPLDSHRSMNLDSYLRSYMKINSKWNIDTHILVRAKTIKLLDSNIGVNLYDLKSGNGFLDMILKAQATTENKYKLDFIKIFF